MSTSAFKIRVPCSSANLGPGYDVFGLALSLYLTLEVTVKSQYPSDAPLNCLITCSSQSQGHSEVSLDPEINLITRAALYVLRCYDQRVFPVGTRVHIINDIPLGRGLGSSGAAVVAGIVLGNEVGKLGLTKERILDYCLMIERHPDNVAAALFGGFVGTILNDLSKDDLARSEIPLSEVLPAPAGGIDTGYRPPEPPVNIGHHFQYAWAQEIKAVVIIPDFQVPTANAREVVPKTISMADAVFNSRRIALLPSFLAQSPPDADLIFLAMRDKFHQPYRAPLVPSLTETLSSLTPSSQPGFLGICLSGAGPTILALATDHFSEIASTVIEQFRVHGISCQWKVLEPAENGATIEPILDVE